MKNTQPRCIFSAAHFRGNIWPVENRSCSWAEASPPCTKGTATSAADSLKPRCRLFQEVGNRIQGIFFSPLCNVLSFHSNLVEEGRRLIRTYSWFTAVGHQGANLKSYCSSCRQGVQWRDRAAGRWGRLRFQSLCCTEGFNRARFPRPGVFRITAAPIKKETKNSDDAALRFSCIMDDAMLAQDLSAATERRKINDIKSSQKTRLVTK